MAYQQLPLGLRLRDSSQFSTYFAGRNQTVVDALRALAPHTGPTSVWLHGPTGAGKTHLLQALCAQTFAPPSNAAYLALREVVALGPDVLSGYGAFAVVAIDDAECIAGAEWERGVFRLHQELEEQGGRMILAAPMPPSALNLQLRDLQSRLNGGLVLKLQPLDEAEQVAALQLRSQHRGLELPADTALFMLRRLPRDLSTLCEFLDELDIASLSAQRRLTTPFVRDVLERKARSVRIRKAQVRDQADE